MEMGGTARYRSTSGSRRTLISSIPHLSATAVGVHELGINFGLPGRFVGDPRRGAQSIPVGISKEAGTFGGGRATRTPREPHGSDPLPCRSEPPNASMR